MPDSRPDILLVSLLANTDNVSLKYLQAALQRAGRDPAILFCASEEESIFGPVAEFVRDGGFDVVAVNLMTPFFPKAAGLSRAIREACGPKVTIVWGGIHPTIDPAGCLEHADWVCVGEAEQGFVEFVDAWRDGAITREVAGFNRAGRETITSCPPPQDLDALAFPEHYPRRAFITDGGAVRPMTVALFRRYSRYRGTYLSVMTTRGCPYHCTYCCNHLLAQVSGRRIRRRGPANVLAEIRANLERSPVRFHYIDFIDDCFTVHSRAWLEEFVAGYRGIGVPLVFRAIPEMVTEEKIAVLARAPAGFALIGLQSGSERTNREVYDRAFSRERVLACARILDRHGVPAIYDVIVDNPYETPEDWEKTIDLLADLPKSSHIFLYSLTFYKNTLLYERALAEGRDVETHLTKSQDHYDQRSRESRAVRLALHFPRGLVKRLLRSHGAGGRLATGALLLVTQAVLDPIRLLWLAFLSVQKRPARFVPLLLAFSLEFFRKIYFPRKVATGYRASSEDEPR
jgi:anaerobic magnesium-protoporphyrin IX monomethyl ester cyclase